MPYGRTPLATLTITSSAGCIRPPPLWKSTGSTPVTSAVATAWTPSASRLSKRTNSSSSSWLAVSTFFYRVGYTISFHPKIFVHSPDGVKYIWTSGRKCDFDGCNRADLQPTIVNGWFWSGSEAKVPPTDQRALGDWSNTGGDGRPQPDNREDDVRIRLYS